MGAVSGPRLGADVLVECLGRYGVDVVFAYPGGTSMAIHQALTRVEGRLRTILPRHEQGGGFAAVAYARATGRTGVCVATSGPGATNLVPCMADAQRYGVPMVVITGQVHSRTLGTDAFQETPIVSMCRNITKHHYLLTRIEDLTRVFKEAFFLATTGRPGPVLVDVPKDVQFRTIVPDFDPPMNFLADLPRVRQPQAEEAQVFSEAELDESAEFDPDAPPAPRQVLVALRDLLEERGLLDQVCLTAGLGPEQGWMAEVFPPRAWMTSHSLSANGFALPAALGLQAADRHRSVVAVATADNLLVNIHELACAFCEKLPVKVLLLNQAPGRLPDFATLARGFRCTADRVERSTELPAALETMLNRPGPCLLDVSTASPNPRQRQSRLVGQAF